jgi:hypothetical protein
MKLLVKLNILLITLLFNPAFIGYLNAQTVKILPLGNSITQSDANHLSYRYPLWTKLIDDGVNFDFVGTMTQNYNGTPVFPQYNGQTFDQNHEGHWGYRADMINNNLASWLNQYTPDIALIHLGTNDLYYNQSITSTINDLKNTINILRSDNPNVKILLAKLVPVDTTIPALHNWGIKIPLLNAQIPDIAIDMDDPNSPIFIVDQYTGFDPLTDHQSDGVHPNEVGEEKIAQKWRETIVTALSTWIKIDIRVYLEGPFTGSEMSTLISNSMSLQQPFNTAPWNYNGTENLSFIPDNITDWILLELRDTTEVLYAGEGTIIAKKACLLKNNGQIVNLDGSSEVKFDVEINNKLFVVVYHRNHLPVISSEFLNETSGVYFYDFTTDSSKALGNSGALKQLVNGVFGMFAGDMNADGVINQSDIISEWNLKAGFSGYLRGDIDLNNEINNKDKNNLWKPNFGIISQLP